MMHRLKIDPEYFSQNIADRKPWEYRRNDRNFRVGDFVRLSEFDRAQRAYTGRYSQHEIIYIYDVGNGYIIMTLSSERESYNFQ